MSSQKSFNKQKNILFLPGWGFDSSIWHNTGNNLGAFNCYFLNFPEVQDQIYGIKDILDQLLLPIPGPATLVGWSLGGLLAIALCMEFPSKFEKLILVASTPKFIAYESWPGISKREGHYFTQTAQKDVKKANFKLLKLIQHPYLNPYLERYLKYHLVDRFAAESLVFYLKFLIETDYRSYYRSLSLPILHILGGKDYLIPPQIITSLRQDNPHVIFQSIPEAGHIPFITHFDITQKLIKEFISI